MRQALQKTGWHMLALALVLLAGSSLASAADYPAPKPGTWVIKNFRFNTGEVMPELKVNYHTVGEPTGEPVLILHGTGGSGRGLLSPGFAGELFGPGQPLDAARHYIILPDSIGAGGSSKPSDGLRMAFPKYNYEDMVRAQHALVTEHLGIRQLKLVLGNSMGGMHTWLWGVMYPDAMRNLVPMASMPVEVAGRNWMTRRMLMEVIKLDPDWNNGNYTRQPRGLQVAQLYFSVATLGGNQGLHQIAPTREKADQYVTDQLARGSASDANDILYQFDALRDYNPAPRLEAIRARLLAINAADDERNPPELGVMERELKRVKNGSLYLIPASPNTRGHGTTGQAKWWTAQLQAWLAQDAARR
ncbi:MAG: alpha/beta fold hydrolase [Hylemonella sp.]|nr:alpha/beta fold hydrolase [Hylemonella sp.]